MRHRWARPAAIMLLLFACSVFFATLMFLFGHLDDDVTRIEKRFAGGQEQAMVHLEVARLDPVSQQVELLVHPGGLPSGEFRLMLYETNGLSAGITVPADFRERQVMRINVIARSHPQSFPDDFYLLEMHVRLIPAGNWGVTPVVLVDAGPSLVDWRMVDHGQPVPWCDGCVDIAFERPRQVRLFVYGVALAPLLLGLSAGLHWLHHRASRSAPIELAAALLALLPLRDVLVPDDIPGITRLDHLLGAEVVLIAVVVAGVTAVSLWRRPLAAPPGSGLTAALSTQSAGILPATATPPGSSLPTALPAQSARFIPATAAPPAVAPPAPSRAAAPPGPGDCQANLPLGPPSEDDCQANVPSGAGNGEHRAPAVHLGLFGHGQADVPDGGVDERRDQGADGA